MRRKISLRWLILAGIAAVAVAVVYLVTFFREDLTDWREGDHLDPEIRLVLEGKAMTTPEQQAQGKALFDQARELDKISSQPPFLERKQARALYEQALRLGYEPAIGELGMSYLDFKAGEERVDDAIELFKIGIEKGDTVAMRGKAILYRYGVPGLLEPDHDVSVALYRRAAELGDVRAQYILGVYLLGLNRTLDPGRRQILPYNKIDENDGVYWSLKAAEGGETRAYETLTNFYTWIRGDRKKAIYYAREGGKRGDQDCLFTLYQGHRAESPYLGNNPALSECYLKLFRKSVHLSESEPVDLDQLCPPNMK